MKNGSQKKPIKGTSVCPGHRRMRLDLDYGGNMNILGSNIKAHRERLGISQTELSKELGYTNRSVISKIEAGLIIVPADKIPVYAECLRCTPESLLGCTSRQYEIYRQLEHIRTGEEMGI